MAAAIVVALCHASAAGAQQAGADPANQPADTAPYVIGLPVFFYTPETRLAFGAGGLLNFRVGHAPTNTRPSSIPFFLVYTQNKQTEVTLKPDIYLPGNRYLLSGTFRFERMPQKFFGIGAGAAASTPEFYTPQSLGLEFELKKRVWKQMWAGVQYAFERTKMRAQQAGGLLAQGSVAGSRGGTVSSLGVSLNVDTRDSTMFPRRGEFVELAVERYSNQLGSEFSYTNAKFDVRAYRPLGEASVAAVQVYVRSTSGSPPFYKLAYLGGDSLLRGYYRGQYRDAAVIVAQAEYRAHLWKRLGAAVFAGLGEVCPGMDRCSVHALLPSVGGGLRIKLDTRGGTNLRIEYAAGRKASAFYVTVQEAF